MEKSNTWKEYQNSQLNLKSENSLLWNIFMGFDYLEDTIIGLLNQGIVIEKTEIEELDIIEHKLFLLEKTKLTQFELQDIKNFLKSYL